MNSHSNNGSSSDSIQKYVDAVIGQQPEPAQTESAQRKLQARLDSATTVVETHKFAWGWATAAAAAVVLPLMLWMPGTVGALAFADVQRHFIGFQTLRAQMTTTVGGDEMFEMTIYVDEQDRARLDAGSGFSYVIDPGRSMMLQLFHDRQRAFMVPLDGPDAPRESTALDWLADIRQFQGQAELLDETSLIRGRTAYGFSLDAGGLDMTLWAAESGEPLRLLISAGQAGAGEIETRLDFEFDRPLDDHLFSLAPPEGYRSLTGVD